MTLLAPNFSVPALRVVVPVYEFAPDNIRVPVPALVMPKLPLTIPPSVRVLLLLTVTVGVAPSTTLPVPRFRSCVVSAAPRAVKLPFHT